MVPRNPIRESRASVIDDADIHRLNGEFYSQYPHSQFGTRLVLALAADEADELLMECLGRRRPLVGDITVEMQEFEPKDLTAVAKLQLLELSHHAAETLLRLFFVHAEDAPCPWIRLAELRYGATHEIANRVSSRNLQLAGDASFDELIKNVCFGADTHEHFAGNPEPGTSIRVATECLDAAAQVVKESAPFNAFKHGLAVSHRTGLIFPGMEEPVQFKIGDDGGSAYVPAFAYIRNATDNELPAEWVRDFAQVDTRERGATVLSMIHLMDNIIGYGAYRRGVPSCVKQTWHMSEGLSPQSFKQSKGPGIIITEPPLPVGPGMANGVVWATENQDEGLTPALFRDYLNQSEEVAYWADVVRTLGPEVNSPGIVGPAVRVARRLGLHVAQQLDAELASMRGWGEAFLGKYFDDASDPLHNKVGSIDVNGIVSNLLMARHPELLDERLDMGSNPRLASATRFDVWG